MPTYLDSLKAGVTVPSGRNLVRKDLGAATAIGSIVTAWTPASGKKVRVLGGWISVSAAVAVLLEDNAAGAGNFLFRTPKLVADTVYQLDFGDGLLLSAIDRVLKMTGSAAANISGVLWGTEE